MCNLECALNDGHDESEAGGVDKVNELGVEQSLQAGASLLSRVLDI